MSDVDPFHPKNAAGPFYVLHGCCIACGVPQFAADVAPSSRSTLRDEQTRL